MLRSGVQIKAARALLGWSQHDLARAARLHVNSVTHWEAKPSIKRSRFDRNSGAARIERALIEAGVAFISDPGPGVHLVAETQFPRNTCGRARTSWGVTAPAMQ